MKLKNTLLAYLRLSRLQTAAVTAVTPVIGGLVMGQRGNLSLFILFLIGFFYHIFGFVLNEYCDIEVDRQSADLQIKPLVSNVITKQSALLLTFVATLCCCVLTVYFFPTVFPILFLLLALLLGGIYDVYGKQIPGADFILGLSFFFICLMGASTVSEHFTTVTYLVCCLYFIHIVFNNAVEGGLKDIDHDTLAGAKTLASRLGVRIQNQRLCITSSFVVFSVVFKGIFFVLIILLLVQPQTRLSLSIENLIQIILILLFVGAIILTMYRFLSASIFSRARLRRLFSIHEISSYFLLVFSLFLLLGLHLTLFLLLSPFLWFLVFNVVLYGNLLQPQV